jgi:23S rRNA (guanine745-N1)-methyltransferase
VALEARARLHAAGVGHVLDAELARLGGELGLARGALAVELGSGTGERLAALAEALGLSALGIDLATAAAELAARRFPAHAWVVANADRRLPLLDSCVALVLTIHGRRNPSECARVLAPGGFLLAALPAPDDLAELRAHVQGEAQARERTAAFLAEHAPLFELCARGVAREQVCLGRGELADLALGTYRGARASRAAALEGLFELTVTLASDVLVLARR